MDSTPGMLQNCSVPFTRLLNSFTADSVTPEPIGQPFRRIAAVAWITTIDEEKAEGLLATVYKTAVARAGRVFNILKIQSVNPTVLESSMDMYMSTMFKQSPLTRGQRELIATVVSRANGCHY